MSESDLDLFDTNLPVSISESATEEPSLSATSSPSTQLLSGWPQEVIEVIVMLSGSVLSNISKDKQQLLY